MDYTRLPEMPGMPNPLAGLPLKGAGAAPQPSKLDIELDQAASIYTEMGFSLPRDITKAALLSGIGRAFMPGQFAAADQMTGISQSTRRYFGNTVQPRIERAVNSGDGRAFALARQLGRVIGAATDGGKLMTTRPPMTVSSDTIRVDGQTVPFSIEEGHVIEYGMGINGLFTHFRNIKAGAYDVTAIHKSRGEAEALRGIAEYYEVPEDGLDIVANGIPEQTKELLEEEGPETADLIIASRVHAAGNALRPGVTNGEQLLRREGLLVARGPRLFREGIGYDQVAAMISKSVRLNVLVDLQFQEIVGGGHVDQSRLIVAEKN